MYHESAQGVDKRMINVHYYYYCRAAPSWRTQAFRWSAPPRGGLLAIPGRITLPTWVIMPPLLVTRPPTTCLVGVKTVRTHPRRRSAPVSQTACKHRDPVHDLSRFKKKKKKKLSIFVIYLFFIRHIHEVDDAGSEIKSKLRSCSVSFLIV